MGRSALEWWFLGLIHGAALMLVLLGKITEREAKRRP